MLHTVDLIWGLLWLGCAVSAAALQVQISPAQADIMIGNSKLFRCRVVGDAKDIDWYNPLGEKILPDNPSISVSRDDEFTSTLMIFQATEDHAGFFRCVAKAEGQEAEAMVRLQLIQGITFKNAPSPQEFNEGDDADVVCEVFSSPAPEILWRKGPKLLKSVSDERFEVLGNGHLLIHNIKKVDEGVYSCEARVLSLGELRSKTIKVVVNTALQVQISPAQADIMVGHSKLFTCRVVGAAKDIDWYNPHGEKILPDNPNISVSRVDEFTSTLMISQATEDHAGFFRCVAKAPGQEAEAMVQLQLIQEITFKNAPSPQEFNEGDDADVVCEVFSSPAPEIDWRKGPNLLKGVSNDRFEVLENGHLLIHNIKKVDEGVYHCEARVLSRGELRSKTINVVVNSAPKIQAQGTVYTWEGNPANISCEVEARPLPDMHWFRDGHKLPNANSNNVKIHNMRTVSYLEISPESQNDFGSYNCKATNILGTDSKEFLLVQAEVPSPPDIQQVEPFSSSAVVRFNKPYSSGGVPILRYRLQWRLPEGEWNSTEYKASDELTNITVTELDSETSYEVRMSAINGRGEGESGKPVSFKTKKARSGGFFHSSLCTLLYVISPPICNSTELYRLHHETD